MIEQKFAEFLHKKCPKVATPFLHNSDIIWNGPKSHQIIRATFGTQFIAKNLWKSPNLVTLIRSQFYTQRLNCLRS